MNRTLQPRGMSPRLARGSSIATLWLCIAVVPAARAEEIYFQDGKRLMAMVEAIDANGKMTLRLPGGRMTTTELAQVHSITFRGRETRAIRAGAQEFHFVSGDRLMGQIIRMHGDVLVAETAMVGERSIPLAALRGFLTMPVEGKAGRRAIELVAGDDEDTTGKMDQVLDRRASRYDGVIEAIDSRELHLDHERLRQIVPLSILHLAGVRLARDAQLPRPALLNKPFVKILTRDGSAVDGLIESVQFGKWSLRPSWQAEKSLPIPAEEIVSVEVLNGQAIYLSQVAPVEVKEKSILSPQQHYRLNQNCQGNPLSIQGSLYAWGIGVHSNSSLAFDIGANWSKLESVIGIDDQAGKGGSVTFQILGDGNSLYRSPVIRGSATTPTVIAVPIKGVKRLTLLVDATDDLDLGDLANWAGTRLVR